MGKKNSSNSSKDKTSGAKAATDPPDSGAPSAQAATTPTSGISDSPASVVQEQAASRKEQADLITKLKGDTSILAGSWVQETAIVVSCDSLSSVDLVFAPLPSPPTFDTDTWSGIKVKTYVPAPVSDEARLDDLVSTDDSTKTQFMIDLRALLSTPLLRATGAPSVEQSMWGTNYLRSMAGSSLATLTSKTLTSPEDGPSFAPLMKGLTRVIAQNPVLVDLTVNDPPLCHPAAETVIADADVAQMMAESAQVARNVFETEFALADHAAQVDQLVHGGVRLITLSDTENESVLVPTYRVRGQIEFELPTYHVYSPLYPMNDRWTEICSSVSAAINVPFTTEGGLFISDNAFKARYKEVRSLRSASSFTSLESYTDLSSAVLCYRKLATFLCAGGPGSRIHLDLQGIEGPMRVTAPILLSAIISPQLTDAFANMIPEIRAKLGNRFDNFIAQTQVLPLCVTQSVLDPTKAAQSGTMYDPGAAQSQCLTLLLQALGQQNVRNVNYNANIFDSLQTLGVLDRGQKLLEQLTTSAALVGFDPLVMAPTGINAAIDQVQRNYISITAKEIVSLFCRLTTRVDMPGEFGKPETQPDNIMMDSQDHARRTFVPPVSGTFERGWMLLSRLNDVVKYTLSVLAIIRASGPYQACGVTLGNTYASVVVAKAVSRYYTLSEKHVADFIKVIDYVEANALILGANMVTTTVADRVLEQIPIALGDAAMRRLLAVSNRGLGAVIAKSGCITLERIGLYHVLCFDDRQVPDGFFDPARILPFNRDALNPRFSHSRIESSVFFNIGDPALRFFHILAGWPKLKTVRVDATSPEGLASAILDAFTTIPVETLKSGETLFTAGLNTYATLTELNVITLPGGPATVALYQRAVRTLAEALSNRMVVLPLWSDLVNVARVPFFTTLIQDATDDAALQPLLEGVGLTVDLARQCQSLYHMAPVSTNANAAFIDPIPAHSVSVPNLRIAVNNTLSRIRYHTKVERRVKTADTDAVVAEVTKDIAKEDAASADVGV